MTLAMVGHNVPMWLCARPNARRELLLVPREHTPIRAYLGTPRFWAALAEAALWVYSRTGESPESFLIPLGSSHTCCLDDGAGAPDHRGLGDNSLLHGHVHMALSSTAMASLAAKDYAAVMGHVLRPARPWSEGSLHRLRSTLAAKAAAGTSAALDGRLAEIVRLLEGSL